MESKDVKDTLKTFVKFGTVFLVYRLCNYFIIENRSSPFLDYETVELAVLVFIGFTVYFNLVRPNVKPNIKNDIIKNIFNDTLMFGTVLLTQHSLDCYMNKGQCFNENWTKNAAMVITAFAAYRVSLDLCVTKEDSPKGDFTRDLAQYGSFLVFYRILQGCNFNEQWLSSLLFVLLGFSVYNTGVSRLTYMKNM